MNKFTYSKIPNKFSIGDYVCIKDKLDIFVINEIIDEIARVKSFNFRIEDIVELKNLRHVVIENY